MYITSVIIEIKCLFLWFGVILSHWKSPELSVLWLLTVSSLSLSKQPEVSGRCFRVQKTYGIIKSNIFINEDWKLNISSKQKGKIGKIINVIQIIKLLMKVFYIYEYKSISLKVCRKIYSWSVKSHTGVFYAHKYLWHTVPEKILEDKWVSNMTLYNWNCGWVWNSN